MTDSGFPAPDFLALPPRRAKPRQVGLTHVIDKGLSEMALRSILDGLGPSIDIVKFGWGTAYVSLALPAKLEACRAAGVFACPGGTLLELAASQGKVSEFADWASAAGFDTVEISDGTIDFGRARRSALIRRLAVDFRVLAEVGSKDPSAPVDPFTWAAEMQEDLEAGAAYVIAEGRESGTVGIYDSKGQVREALVDRIVERVPVDRIIFEAPNKAHQAWFVDRFGADANIGNVNPDDVLGVETLRRGLRADTASHAVRSFTPSLVAQALFERSG